MLKLLVPTTHLPKHHNPSASVPEENRISSFHNKHTMMHVQCTCVYSCVCCVWLCDESVHLGISVFLVPFLNFDSKFIVKSLAKEWPRIFIHRSTTAFSNSTLYRSYLAGMLWQMVSQWWRIESHPRAVYIILAFTLVSGVFPWRQFCWGTGELFYRFHQLKYLQKESIRSSWSC